MKRLCVVVLLFALALPGGADEPPLTGAVGAVTYLSNLENKDGGFRATAAPGPSSLGATSAAVRALAYHKLPPRWPDAAKAFVESCYDKASGGFADTPGGKPDVRLTAVGAMAAAALGLADDARKVKLVAYLSENAADYEGIRIAVAGLEALRKPAPKADAWRKQVEALVGPEGTWGTGDGAARDTGGAAVILLRLGVKLKGDASVLKVLDGGQRADGGYGKAGAKASDLETTYRVMRCYHMLGKQPGGPTGLRDFVAKCQNKDGGYGVAPGEPSSVSGTYYALSITHWLAK